MSDFERLIAAIQVEPLQDEITWGEIFRFLDSKGAERTIGNNNIIVIELNGVSFVSTNHADHRRVSIPEARSLRTFLLNAGVF